MSAHPPPAQQIDLNELAVQLHMATANLVQANRMLAAQLVETQRQLAAARAELASAKEEAEASRSLVRDVLNGQAAEVIQKEAS